MKKLIFVVIIGLLVGTAAFADHPDGLGIGVVGGGGWSNNGYGSAGLSLKVGGIPIFWGIYFPFMSSYVTSVGISGDYYVFDNNLVAQDMTNEDGTYKFKLDWYLGLGGYVTSFFYPSGAAFDVGVRVPVGLSWHIIKQLELFLGIVPGLGIYVGNSAWFHFAGTGEIGLRLWL